MSTDVFNSPVSFGARRTADRSICRARCRMSAATSPVGDSNRRCHSDWSISTLMSTAIGRLVFVEVGDELVAAHVLHIRWGEALVEGVRDPRVAGRVLRRLVQGSRFDLLNLFPDDEAEPVDDRGVYPVAGLVRVHPV